MKVASSLSNTNMFILNSTVTLEGLHISEPVASTSADITFFIESSSLNIGNLLTITDCEFHTFRSILLANKG